MNIQIRLAQETDYAKLMDLYNTFVGSDRYSNHDNDSFKSVLKSKNNYVFVAFDGDTIVGFITFSVRLVVRYPKPIAELDELYVEEKYRRSGVGKLLMEKVLDKAEERGCYRLYIESHYSHEIAHAFYESLGFTKYGFHFIKNI